MAELRAAGIAGCGLAMLAMLVSGCGSYGGSGSSSVAGSGGLSVAGSGGSSAAGSGGAAWVSPVAQEVAQHWTWQECGRISPNPADGRRHNGYNAILSLAISNDGSLLVSDAYTTIGWRVAEAFGDSEPLWLTGAEGGSNVALSPDGRFGTISGDVRLIFDTTTGEQLFWEGAETNSGPLSDCFGSEFNFSPDSKLVAGKHYLTTVDVIETEGFTRVGYLDTPGCAQGVMFSGDGSSLVTPDASAALTQLATTPPAPRKPTDETWRWQSLTRAPDGSMVPARCNSDDTCVAITGYIAWPGARHLAISAEGQWVALGGKLLDLYSGEERVFDDVATEAVFAPNGDIIAGEQDASLVRFCRAD